VANSQEDSFSQHPEDLLAAVVLHTLLSGDREGMSEEIEAALAILLEDGLAERETPPHKALYRATRAAIRANELSF